MCLFFADTMRRLQRQRARIIFPSIFCSFFRSSQLHESSSHSVSRYSYSSHSLDVGMPCIYFSRFSKRFVHLYLLYPTSAAAEIFSLFCFVRRESYLHIYVCFSLPGFQHRAGYRHHSRFNHNKHEPTVCSI